jgi:hypothetical protein
MMFGKIFGKSQAPSFRKQSTEPERSADPKQAWVHSFSSIKYLPAKSVNPVAGPKYPELDFVSFPAMGKIAPFQPVDYPTHFYLAFNYDDEERKEYFSEWPVLPEFFRPGTLPCMSRQYCEVFSRHKLGLSQFFPVTVFQNDRQTRLPGEFSGMYFGEVKSAVAYDKSSGLKIYNSMVGPLFAIRIVPEQGQFAVRSSALDELDMWIDPQCYDVFFVSGRLKQALDEIGLTPAFNFKSCRMI